MAQFDLARFGTSLGRDGQDLLGALGTEYGVPSCLMNMAQDVLNQLPSNVLGAMRNNMQQGRNAADAVSKAVSKKLLNLGGLIEFGNDDGSFNFVSDASQFGQDANDSGNIVSNFLAGVTQAAAFGAQLYSNYVTATEQVEEMLECLDAYDQYLQSLKDRTGNEVGSQGNTDPNGVLPSRVETELGPLLQSKNDAKTFLSKVNDQIKIVDKIISDRINNPDLEPQFTEAPQVSAPPESVFRLEAGPPDSDIGQFILSVDGLYYDSQTSGTAPALLELEERSKVRDPSLDWKMEYDPSLGGKGSIQTMQDLDKYFDTIFDHKIIDDSPFMQEYYDKDNIVVNILGQRNRKIYDVSAELQQHIDAGSSQAIISNLKQVMISESVRFMNQVNKRKKQIELAVKMPRIYGKGQLYSPGKVPINDFSYLEGVNYDLDLKRQRSIVIRQDEVKGVVLPLETKFSKPAKRSEGIGFEHLYLNGIPDGIIIDSANASASTSASLAAIPPLVSDNLFALYNYLTLEGTDPSSSLFKLRNSTVDGVSSNGQIAGDFSNILKKGLGIPYFSGVAIPDNTGGIVKAGSYARAPSLQKFQDFLYTKNGATFETWVYVPDLSSVDAYNHTSEVSGLYRLILANENTGDSGEANADDILNMSLNNNIGVTKGLICGFTRDRRFTQKKIPSNADADNPVRDVSLVVAPTQSFDASSAGFISNILELDSCRSASSWKGLVVPVSSTYNGQTLSSCTEEFCQLSITFNPVRNEIKVYLDGVNLTTSSYNDVFGINPRKENLQIPSIPPENAFEYNTLNIASSSLEAYRYGPKRDEYFTPWIIGGGYTDGNPNGNFMGGEYGGKISGLKGHIGCTRFYSKPLSNSEVVNNYKATKNFFKNIKL